jgi:hypothetical protein
MTRASLLLASLIVLAAPSARAIDGFTLGIEYARGGWNAKSDELALQTGGIGALYGAALAARLARADHRSEGRPVAARFSAATSGVHAAEHRLRCWDP